MISPRLRTALADVDKRPDRNARIEAMAKDLIRFDALGCEQDSIRSLYGRGYPMIDIVMLLDDARQVAFQDIVAKEMSEP
jgi:hypothetical protein